MKTQFCKTGLILILLSLGISSCVNLKHVNEFSASSLASLSKFEEIDYSFKQNCLENCQDSMINNLIVSQTDCNCANDEKADSVTLVIYQALKGYFDGLTHLSDNELTNYKMDPLNNALINNSFGSVKLDKTEVEAYSNISKIIIHAFTDGYRKQKIKKYITDANDPVKVLIHYLDLNLSSNLVGKIDVQKQRIGSYYFDLTKDSTISTIDKRKAVQEYYLQLDKIEARQNELHTYSKALAKIAQGHQVLVDNIDKLSAVEIREQLTQYSSDIQNIVSEFNKIKK